MMSCLICINSELALEVYLGRVYFKTVKKIDKLYFPRMKEPPMPMHAIEGLAQGTDMHRHLRLASTDGSAFAQEENHSRPAGLHSLGVARFGYPLPPKYYKDCPGATNCSLSHSSA